MIFWAIIIVLATLWLYYVVPFLCPQEAGQNSPVAPTAPSPEISPTTPAIEPNAPEIDSEASLKELILRFAKDYYRSEWEISLSQYQAWIHSIDLTEAGGLGASAHSGAGIGRDVFYHKTIGNKFPFSTGIGYFQLDNGKRWTTMPTIDKLDPKKSLISVLRWHRDNFGAGSTLADFQKKSVWCGVKSKRFEGCWRDVAGVPWEECKDKKMEVPFHSPMAKLIGKVRWDLPGFQGYFETWLITAKTYLKGKGYYCFSYYYAADRNSGWEVWVWSKENLVQCYKRNYSATQFPDGKNGECAGFTSAKPALYPNDKR